MASLTHPPTSWYVRTLGGAALVVVDGNVVVGDGTDEVVVVVGCVVCMGAFEMLEDDELELPAVVEGEAVDDVVVVVDDVVETAVGGALVDGAVGPRLSARAVDAAAGLRGSETSSRTIATAWVAIQTESTLAANHAATLNFLT